MSFGTSWWRGSNTPGFGGGAAGGGGGFSPLSLFASGEQGAWYDPSDLSSMYQDSAGTIPAAVGQPVGRILDKSGRGNHATQATTSLKPILRQSGSLYYLEFDGVDDGMVTASINFTATDKMTVFAGVRKLNETASAIAEFSVSSSATNGSFGLFSALVSGNIAFRSRGSSAFVDASAMSLSAPVTAVITGESDISAPYVRIRRDGAAASSNVGVQGVTNYGNHALYLGRRGGSSLPFTGNLYSLIIRGALTDAAGITNGEKFTATRTGVTLA